MVYWRQNWAIFQVIYFMVVLIAIQCSTIYVIDQQIKFARTDEVDNKTLYTASLVANLLMFPSNILTYRSKLLTMKILKQVKMHRDYKGKGYNSNIRVLNIVFWGWYPYAKLAYHKYLLLRLRIGQTATLHALYFKIIAIVTLIATQVYRTAVTSEFTLPQWYIPLLLMLEFSRYVIFVLKICTFWPVYGVYRIRYRDAELDIDHDLELDKECRKIMYPAKYLNYLFYLMAVNFYPAEQWLLLMWCDHNPYIEYRHCNFCNEMFMPGEHVYCDVNCKNRLKGAPHYFHVIC